MSKTLDFFTNYVITNIPNESPKSLFISFGHPTAAILKTIFNEYHDPMNNDSENGLIWTDDYSFANDYFNFCHDGALRDGGC